MNAVKIGIKEFKDRLASFLFSDKPVAIVLEGGTIGYYLPVRHRRAEAERESLQEATLRLRETLSAAGVSEDQAIQDFKSQRSAKVFP